MLRKIRIILAAIFFIGITLLFVGIGGQWWGWMARLQFLPSLFALNAAVIVGILLLTILFGRVYCSIICPMGVFQDIIISLRRFIGRLRTNSQARRFRRLKAKGAALPKPKTYAKKFNFVKEHVWVRYPVLAAAILSVIFSSQFFISLIAPYSAYGRIVRSIAGLGKGQSIAPALLITAGITLVVIFICAWVWGREYCNTICPVGTTLSLFSRFSLFRPVIDESKCVACGRCYHNCKASCIDGKAHSIDYTRCIDCFDCINTCSEGAIKYRFVALKPADYNINNSASRHAAEVSIPKADASITAADNVDAGRRNFIITTAVLVGTGIMAQAQNKRLDGGLAAVIDKKSPVRGERLVPYGAVSVKHFYDRCTGCQLCVAVCPNGVLRASSDLGHFLQPEMGYEKGYCRPECTECSHVCPSGAILPISKEEKHLTAIGIASVDYSMCLAATGKASCGNCSRHCNSGAIRMVFSDKFGHPVPIVAEEQCIGCGAGENLCPSRPISAITGNGIPVHHKKS